MLTSIEYIEFEEENGETEYIVIGPYSWLLAHYRGREIDPDEPTDDSWIYCSHYNERLTKPLHGLQILEGKKILHRRRLIETARLV